MRVDSLSSPALAALQGHTPTVPNQEASGGSPARSAEGPAVLLNVSLLKKAQDMEKEAVATILQGVAASGK